MNAAKILVVDDNTADITLLRMALDQQGEEYELEILRNGEEALNFVDEHRTGARSPEPCVIILDLHLPKHDGLAVLAAIRQSPDLAHVSVVILSGLASLVEREGIARLNGRYVQKPFELSEFIELGAEIFALCRSAAAVAA